MAGDVGVAQKGETQDIERLGIDVIRGFSMDGPFAASSGHQGTAMALAPVAHVLFTRVMRFDAADADWPDRDRFILSNGHASILQYSLLYLTGFGLTLDDLKNFRQWDSKTPGHPEVGHTKGVEVTTGPLGQGFAHAVGMAMAERRLRAEFGEALCDHYTWVLCGDGDLAEGISHEAASLAGFQKLGRLICVYDDNHISIDGTTEEWMVDDATGRFQALGWHVIELHDAADDLDALEAALLEAKAVTDKPSLIRLRTHIGTPSPTLTDSPSAHGNPFKADEIAATKEAMGIPNEPFWVTDDVINFYRERGARGAAENDAWKQRLAAAPAPVATRWSNQLSITPAQKDWAQSLPAEEPGTSIATRVASNACLNVVADAFDCLVAGSADLTGNTGVKLDGATPMTDANPAGRQIYFGVREHAMAAAMNGMALHGGVLPVGGTFLVFSDYCRPAIRLAALQRAKVVFSFTHDSVGVGEDGPTHQPIEQAAALRAIPDLCVIRPADATETAGAWQCATDYPGPTALILTRQGVPVLEATNAASVAQGGYVLHDADDASVTLIGAGSELQLCVAAREALATEGITARVVSMPSWNLFNRADEAYRSAVLGTAPRLAVEAGSPQGWFRYADEVIGIERFGASAPAATVMANLGITAEAVTEAARRLARA